MALIQNNFQHDYREALFHLYKYAGITVSATASLEKAITVLDKDIIDPLYFITFSQVMLILDNYLVEYDSFLQSSDSVIGERIRKFKVIVQPAISTLRRWDGLHSFRNHVLAHSFRLKSDGNKSVFRDGDYYLYDIPQTAHELSIIISCVRMITSIMEKLFGDELMEIIRENENTKRRLREKVSYRQYTHDTRQAEIANIENEINARIIKFNEQNRRSSI